MERTTSLTVPRIKLGSQGLEVSRIGLGCMSMSGNYGPPKPETEMIKVLHHAIDTGVTFLDTSDVYGPLINEILIGKAIKGMREKVQIATKSGICFEDGKRGICGEPAYVRACCEASLKRLDIDCIDLYYVHRIDTQLPIEVTILGCFCGIIHPLDMTGALLIRLIASIKSVEGVERDEVDLTSRRLKMGELKKLVEEGKIKYIGLSEACASTIRRAHAVHPITAVQMEWSLWTRDLEEEVVPTCRELGIGIVPYSPLGRGFFSAGTKLIENLPDDDFRKSFPRFKPENFKHNKQVYEKLNLMAARKGCTPSQLALAWVLHQGDDVCPIPGTTKIENFNENVGALSIKLTAEDMKELESYASGDDVKGERHVYMSSTWINSETPPLSSWKAE